MARGSRVAVFLISCEQTPRQQRSRSWARLPAPACECPHARLSPFPKECDEVEVEPENGKVIIKPLIGAAEFKRELKGCVENLKINPIEVKRIWNA